MIGSGTGYSAAVLKEIGLEVVALEADEALAASSRSAAGVDTVVGGSGQGLAQGRALRS